MSESSGKDYSHTLGKVGERYATYRMKSDLYSLDDFIKTLGDDKLSMSLMAAMVRRLETIEIEIRALGSLLSKQIINDERKRDIDKKGDPADGMLMALRATEVDVPIDLCDRTCLSVRARKALINGKFLSLAQLTQEAILDVKNCGMSTWVELEAWRRLQYEQLSGSNGEVRIS
jgi:hypothetical protein